MLIEDGSMTGTEVITTDPVYLDSKTTKFSITSEWSGTPIGSLKLQITSAYPNRPADGQPAVIDDKYWTDLTGSTVSVSGSAGNHTYDIVDASYAWVRLVYTNTLSTGTLNSWMHEKVS